MDKKILENFEATLNNNYTNLVSIDMKRLIVTIMNHNSKNELEIVLYLLYIKQYIKMIFLCLLII